MQVFFARIPKSIQEEEIAQVFQQAGEVKEVVLFKTHASATVNKVSVCDMPSLFEGCFPAMLQKMTCQEGRHGRFHPDPILGI